MSLNGRQGGRPPTQRDSTPRRPSGISLESTANGDFIKVETHNTEKLIRKERERAMALKEDTDTNSEIATASYRQRA